MSKINIDFNSILQPIKDAQNELTKLLSQMQEASKASQSMAAGIRSSGGSRFSSIEAAGNYVKNMRSIHGDNVIAMPGVPLSNLDPSQHASSPTTSPTNPIAQAARANVSSNLDSVSFARALNTSFDLQKSAPNRQAMINNLQKGDQVSKYFGNQMSDLGDQSSSLQKQIADLSKQALDSNGREIKANTEANNKLREAISKLNKTTDELTSLQDEANKYLKGAGGGGGEGGSEGPGGIRGYLKKMGGARIAGSALALAGQALSSYGQYNQLDAVSTLNTNTNIASVQQSLFQQQMSAAAPMSGRDILRQYGNLVAPGVASKYTGTRGFGISLGEARSIQEQKLSGAGQEFLGNLAAAAGAGALTGMAATSPFALAAASTLVGAPLAGIGTAAAGVLGGLTGAGAYLLGNNSEYMKSQGGKLGILGTPGGNRAKRLYESGKMVEQIGMAQQMQENELNSQDSLRRAQGLDIRMAAMSAMVAGTSLVGGNSTNGLDILAGTNLRRLAQQNSLDQQLLNSKGATLSQRKAAFGRINDPLKAADRAAATAADTLMDGSEIGQASNLLTSVMGRRATGGETTSFAKMRFAGVGGLEQIASQMLGLQSTSNSPVSMVEFKKILSEGVSAGFSSAPLMQAFMGTLTQLSQSLGSSDSRSMSGDLNMMSTGLSVTGRGGMRSLRESAMAMSSMGSYTGQTSGVVGMMKTVAGFSGGLSMQSGLAVANTMNSVQLTETRDSLEKIANSPNPQETLNKLEKEGKISKDASRIARTNMNNVGGAARALGAMADASQAQARGMINLALGGSTTFGDLSKRMGALMQQKGGTRTDEFKNLEAQLALAAEGSGMDKNAAFMMARDAAFSGMTVEQRRAATKNLRASGGEFGRAQAAGEAEAKSNVFLAAQKSLSGRLGTEAAIDAGGFASQSSIDEVAKSLDTNEKGIRKRLGLGENAKIRSEDLTGLLAQGAGNVNTVNIGGLSSSALNSLGLAFSIAIGRGEKVKNYVGTKPGVEED